MGQADRDPSTRIWFISTLPFSLILNHQRFIYERLDSYILLCHPICCKWKLPILLALMREWLRKETLHLSLFGMERKNSCHMMINVTFPHLCTLFNSQDSRKKETHQLFIYQLKAHLVSIISTFTKERTAADTVIAQKLYKAVWNANMINGRKMYCSFPISRA